MVTDNTYPGGETQFNPGTEDPTRVNPDPNSYGDPGQPNFETNYFPGGGGPTVGGSGSTNSKDSFWDNIGAAWYTLRQKKEAFNTAEAERDAAKGLKFEAQAKLEASRNTRDQARDARGKAFQASTQRALDMAITAGTFGGAPSKESMAIYDSPALRAVSNPLADPKNRSNLIPLRNKVNPPTKDLRQYTAGTESMRGLHETSELPAKDALIVAPQMKKLNTAPLSMQGLNSPSGLIKNKPDFGMQRLNSSVNLSRLRKAGDPASAGVMPIAPINQAKLGSIRPQGQLINPKGFTIKPMIANSTPLSRVSTQSLMGIKRSVGPTPIPRPQSPPTIRTSAPTSISRVSRSPLKLQTTPRSLGNTTKLLGSGIQKPASKGFDNSYYQRNMSKFRKEAR